jgi:hypothetical protein
VAILGAGLGGAAAAAISTFFVIGLLEDATKRMTVDFGYHIQAIEVPDHLRPAVELAVEPLPVVTDSVMRQAPDFRQSFGRESFSFGLMMFGLVLFKKVRTLD